MWKRMVLIIRGGKRDKINNKLLSLGLPWTILRLFVGDKIPDHGFWARGTDRMYIHRGTGHYGFPLRLGVPAEESVLRVHRAIART